MDLKHEFRDVRRSALDKQGVYALTSGQRGYRVNSVQECIEGAAAAAHLEFGGQFRKARLMLAQDIFEKEVLSYNGLADHELVALDNWARGHGREIKDWLLKTFGEQLPLL